MSWKLIDTSFETAKKAGTIYKGRNDSDWYVSFSSLCHRVPVGVLFFAYLLLSGLFSLFTMSIST